MTWEGEREYWHGRERVLSYERGRVLTWEGGRESIEMGGKQSIKIVRRERERESMRRDGDREY